jgi:adenosylcobinamide-phosphate synthase
VILSPVAAAFAADFVLGDPVLAWHPVRLMGKVIHWADRRFPRSRLSGLCLALGLPSAVAALTWSLLRLAGPGAWCLEAFLLFFCIAGRDMVVHSSAVLAALKQQDLGLARERVSGIVGRDTGSLDEAGLLRACIESTAESLCDGLVAPLFFAYLGGAPLALAHKAVSTLDSMVGHKDPRYLEFGWASARLDDLLNFLPARFSALCAALASGSPWKALRCAFKDAPRQPSPNSGWPEGAFAGALGLRLGGPLSYRGTPVDKAFLGEEGRVPDMAGAEGALRLFQRASILALVTGELLWHWLRA